MICSLRRTVLKTCGRRRTWQIAADAVAGLGDGHAVAPLGDEVEDRQDLRRDAGYDRLTFPAIRVTAAFRSASSVVSALRSASTAFCSAARADSATLHVGGKFVGLDHQLEGSGLRAS